MRGGAVFLIVSCVASWSTGALAAPSLNVSAVQLSVDTPRIVLGETERASVTIKAKTPAGEALDVAPPRLSVSAGSISAPQRTAAGVWRAIYTPPADRFPHVAILLAVIDTKSTTSVGFLPLHLWGQGQTVVKTKPGSAVTVYVGNESFGPVTAQAVAGGDAEARVPIVVPPGPERAVAKSVDALGNTSQKTIDLAVPTFLRVALLALDDVATADATGVARLLAFAVDKKGEPLFAADLDARASTGNVDLVGGVAPGMFLLAFHPGVAASGSATVDVALKDAPQAVAQRTITLLSGRPTRTQFVATDTLNADAPREVAVTVEVFDAADNAVPASAVSVDVDYGRIDSTAINGAVRTLSWVVPATDVAAHPSAQITARLPGGEVVGSHRIALSCGAPARLEFGALPPVLADGSTSLDIVVRVSDAAGNALSPAQARITVDPALGDVVGAAVDSSAGTPVLRARFVPAARTTDGAATLVATLNDVTAQRTVQLRARPRAVLLIGTGLAGNVSNNNAGYLGIGPALSLLLRLPMLDGALHAGLDLAMLQSLLGDGVDRRDFPLLLEGAWRPSLWDAMTLHVGGGAGLVMSDVSRNNARSVEPSLATQAVVGVGYRLGPGVVEADLRAGYSYNIARSLGANSDAGPPIGLGVVVGYRFGI